LFVCSIFILLLLVRSHQAEIIIVKRLTKGRNNVSDEGGSWIYITRSWSHGRRKNGALTLLATLPILCMNVFILFIYLFILFF